MRIMQIALFRAKFKLRTTTNLFASPHVASSTLSLFLVSLPLSRLIAIAITIAILILIFIWPAHCPCPPFTILHLPLRPLRTPSMKWNECRVSSSPFLPSPCSLFGVFPLADFRHLHQKFKNSINYSVEFSAFLYFSLSGFLFFLFFSLFFLFSIFC